MDINRTIQVTNKGMYPILSVAQGTNTVKMNFTISDFSIPSGSSAVAYNIQPTGNIVSQICTVSGNTVSVTPPAYYFLHGKNLMQFQISNGNSRLITFVMEVWCSPDISNPEVVEMSNPTVTQQLLSQVGMMTDRLNNLAKLPEGSTTGDAELADIRVGADGVTYETAGEAVREQVSTLKTGVDQKVNTNQGTNNIGKAMVVGDDGNLKPGDVENELKDREVTGVKTIFWNTNNLDLVIKTDPLPKISIPYCPKFYQGTSDGKSYFYFVANTSRETECVLLKPDTEYMIFCSNQTFTSTSQLLTNDTLRDLTPEEKNNLETVNMINTDHIKYITLTRKTHGLYQTYSGKFKVTEDTYLINIDPKNIFEVYLWDDVEYLNKMTNLSNIYHYMSNITYRKFYDDPYQFTTNNRYTGLEFSPFFNKYEFDKKMYRMIRRTNYIDGVALSTLNLYFIGDSITYAASNAGLQRGFRKQVPYKLNVSEASALAVNGTCITNGYGSPFNSNDPGSTGVNGILKNLSVFDTIPDDPTELPHIFIIALGTNDFGNNAPLGNVENDDREITFAGCYLKLIENIRDKYPNSGVICMCPFNRSNAGIENTEGHILLDYSRVIHEIVSITRHSWILDLSNHPIINYSNYPEAYVDPVHIGPYAHAVVTNYLSELILQVVVESGFDLYSVAADSK